MMKKVRLPWRYVMRVEFTRENLKGLGKSRENQGPSGK
jgi:hypothetical protein